jgi:toxin ParE1/3/4
MKFRFTSKAKFDLNSIWTYTVEKWSQEQADRYYNQLMAELEYISDNPKIGRDFARDGKRYRFRAVQSHLIFYRFTSEGEIEVIRILHKRMDLDNHLQD